MPGDGSGAPEDRSACPGWDTACPSSEALQAFSQGRLPGAAVESIGRHVDTCPDCAGLLDALGDGDDTLAENVRRLIRQGPAPPEAAVARIEARARAIALGRAGDALPTLSDHAPPTEGQGPSLLGP